MTTMEGFLDKHSPKVGGGWQKRWFVLRDGRLSYFKLQDARSMFDEMDADKSGFLDSGEVAALCKKMGRKMNGKEVATAMGEMDKDGNDQVEFDEFERWWSLHGGKGAKDRTSAKDSIDLSAVIALAAAAARGINLTSPDLGDGARTYTLRAATPELRQQWLTALKTVCPESAFQDTTNMTNREAKELAAKVASKVGVMAPILAGHDGSGTKEGFLEKLSPAKTGGWQQRWFVLGEGKLAYFKTKDAKSMFIEMDIDHSGFLDGNEVANLCKKMGKKLSSKEVASAMKEMDQDGSGEVDFAEFSKWWETNGGKSAKAKEAKDAIDITTLQGLTGVGTRELVLVTSARTYRLRADSSVLTQEWLAALKFVAPEAAWYDFEVTFTEEGSLGMGLHVHEGSPTIKHVVKGSQAQRNHQEVTVGLRIQRIGGVDVTGKEYDDVITIIKGAGRPLTVNFLYQHDYHEAQAAIKAVCAAAAPPPAAAAAPVLSYCPAR